jgi:3-methyladenine DNA glycosylase Mpg
MALNIDKELYGEDVTHSKKIYITSPYKKESFEIVTSKRIGLNVGVDFPYRFFIKNSPFVTKHKFNNEIIL